MKYVWENLAESWSFISWVEYSAEINDGHHSSSYDCRLLICEDCFYKEDI